eukprot:CAMPEP_0116882904 /NCGR_PEP_ID=MMETSP0463-20121206/15303_1 /TAXON_ID=181622 /ORGANISM="Strombidinopsis sp, Strain SopsisLIS2011" /LENGTH=71 /DNA_ID=CAMNT_0004536889 /DNA_START=1013 /DNA_END=1228 /DNA_ORIENTATION=+
MPMNPPKKSIIAHFAIKASLSDGNLNAPTDIAEFATNPKNRPEKPLDIMDTQKKPHWLVIIKLDAKIKFDI